MEKCEVSRCRRTDVITFMRRRICTRHYTLWCEKRIPNLKCSDIYKHNRRKKEK